MTECATIKQDGEEYRIKLDGDWRTATVTHESGVRASIGYRQDSYRACVLNMSGEAGSMRDAVDIAIDLIRVAREGKDAA